MSENAVVVNDQENTEVAQQSQGPTTNTLFARKLKCTQVFQEDGSRISVTVLSLHALYIVQVKTLETDGYQAIQVGYKEKKRHNKPMTGHFQKAQVPLMTHLVEIRLPNANMADYAVGSLLSTANLAKALSVDVSGHTIGKGFAGCIKRHNFSMQCASHGVSLSHRVPGSTGQCQFPGRVFPGKKMAGRMGNKQRTVKNLKVISFDSESGTLMVKGAVPGHKNSEVMIRLSAFVEK